MNGIPPNIFDPNKFIDDWVNEKHPNAMKKKKTYAPSLKDIPEDVKDEEIIKEDG